MEKFNTLSEIIVARRSNKPATFNGEKIEDSIITDLLNLAHWAPTHGRTEPWRFKVYANEGVSTFCEAHAALYKTNTDPEVFTTAKFENLQKLGSQTSHIIGVYMQRQVPAKIPLVEEIAATAAAIQNILLGAEALGISALWSTGGMTHHPALKSFWGLADEDVVMGLLYLGYTNEPAAPGKRNGTAAEKTSWIK
jgi:nitroreductase